MKIRACAVVAALVTVLTTVSSAHAMFGAAEPAYDGTHPAGLDTNSLSTAISGDGSYTAVAKKTLGDVVLVEHRAGTAPSAFVTTTLGSGSSEPHHAVDAAGNVLAVWRNSANDIVARVRLAGSEAFAAPEVLDRAATGEVRAAVVAGRLLVVWEEAGSIWWTIRTTSGVWSSPAELRTGGADLALTDVVTSRSGAAAALVVDNAPSRDQFHVYELAPAATTWSDSGPLGFISPSERNPRLAYANSGAAMATWVTYVAPPALQRPRIAAAHRPAAGPWTTPTDDQQFAITPDDSHYDESPDVAAAPDGTFTVVWTFSSDQIPGTNDIRTLSFGAGEWDAAGFVRVSPIAERFEQTLPQIEFTAGGAALVQWLAYDGGHSDVIANVRASAADSWDPNAAVALNDQASPGISQYDMHLVTDDLGNAVSSFVQSGPVLRVAPYAGGAWLSDITVPTTGSTTSSVTVSAQATAPWSSTAPMIEWFVDGVSVGTGATRQLALSAGRHEVVAKSGTRTSAIHAIVVSAPGAPADTDGDGVSDASDCAPNDHMRPARGAPDADCDGLDDVEEIRTWAEEEARKAAEEAIKRAIAVNVAIFTKEARAAQAKVPAVVPATTILSKAGMTVPIQALKPQITIGQLSGVVSAGGANVVSAGGGNVISAGGANVVSAGGANLNRIAAAGVVSAGGANVVSPGGANLIGRARPHARQVLLGSGGITFRTPATGKIRLVLSPQGRKVIAAYRAKAIKLRTQGRRVAPLRLRYTTITGPVTYGSAPAVFTTKLITIRG